MKLARNSYFRIHYALNPDPEVGMVFQDGTGERYMVVALDRRLRLIQVAPVGRRNEERLLSIGFDVWEHQFRHERRFPWLVVP